MLSTTSGGQTRTYHYNGDRLLIGQESAGNSTSYVQDLAAPLSQILQISQGGSNTTYLYGQERLVAMSGGTRTWYGSDGLGSVRQTVSDAGAPLNSVNYNPRGQVETGSVSVFGFTGELQDATTGLVNLRARWYHTGHGTFTTFRWRTDESDDILPYTHHGYAYTLSNPVLYTDPDGRCARQGEPECFSWREFASTLFSEYFLGRPLVQYTDQDLLEDYSQLQEKRANSEDLSPEEQNEWLSLAFTLGIVFEGPNHWVREPNIRTSACEETTPKGARGPYSGRPFDPEKAGGSIRQLSTDKVRITERGVDAVEHHVSRFGPDEANQGMINRLRRISAGELEPTAADVNFYAHELRESVRYRRLGWRTGQPIDPEEAYDLWNNAHTATLEDYQLYEGPMVLYHRDFDPY